MEPVEPLPPPAYGDELRRALSSLWAVLAVVGGVTCLIGLPAAVLGFVGLSTAPGSEGMDVHIAKMREASRVSMWGVGGVALGFNVLLAAVQVRRTTRVGPDEEARLAFAVRYLVSLLVWGVGTLLVLATIHVSEFAFL